MNYYGFKNMGTYDKEEHDAFLSKYPSIYHYTKRGAFENILKTGSLWATKCTHFYKDIYETHLVIPALKKIATKLDQPFRIYTESTIKVVSQKMARERERLFAVCFSKDENSKKLWDNDGDKNDIRFELDTITIDKLLSWLETSLTNTTDAINCEKLFNEVIYNDEKLIKVIKLFNNQFNNEQYRERELKETIENPTNIFALLAQLSVFSKEIKFTKESEIRASFMPLVDDYKTFEKIRLTDKGNISFLDISFKSGSKLHLKSIRINPEHNEYYKTEIESLLKDNGYDVPVY